MIVSCLEQRRNPSFCRDDDGGTRVGERVSLGGCVTQMPAIVAGDVGDKHCQFRPKGSPQVNLGVSRWARWWVEGTSGRTT